MGSILELNGDNFASEVLESEQAVLVDFWAPWCGPCRQLTPVIEQLAEANAGVAKVTKFNIDDNTEIAQNYKVMSIPTVIVFKGGSEARRFVGVATQQQLQEAIDEAT